MTVPGITRRLVFGAAVLAPMLVLAQTPGPLDNGPRPARGVQGGPGDDRPRPPGPPIMAALDTNRDGELSPEKIRNASAALKSLDHNHDGTLDRSELRPPDGGPGGPPVGLDGPRDSPPGGRRPLGPGRGRPQIGHVLPPFVRDQLTLTDRQFKQIAELENDVRGKLQSILTAGQLRQLRDLIERGPGGRGRPGGRGPGARGEPPGGGQPDDEEGPPVRPQRPRQP